MSISYNILQYLFFFIRFKVKIINYDYFYYKSYNIYNYDYNIFK